MVYIRTFIPSTIECQSCGTPFAQRSPTHIYGSAACRTIAYVESLQHSNVVFSERTCPACEKTFIPIQRVHTYCTAKCRNVVRKARKQPRLPASRCLLCATAYRQHNDTARFCRVSCAVRWQRLGKYSNYVNVGTCAACETSCPGSIHCSRECAGRHIYPLLLKLARQFGSFEVLTHSETVIRRSMLSQSNKCCSVCGLTDWMGKYVVLQIDHIDGNSSNNRLDNLRLVCPNCHSQTPTFGSKNKGMGRRRRQKASMAQRAGQLAP